MQKTWENFPAIIENIGEQAVNAKYLHYYLESKQDFSNWIKDGISKYGFINGEDFSTNLLKSTGGRPSIDYILALDTAREIAMVEGNEKGVANTDNSRKYWKHKSLINRGF